MSFSGAILKNTKGLESPFFMPFFKQIQKHYNYDTLNQNYNTREIYINVTFNVN